MRCALSVVFLICGLAGRSAWADELCQRLSELAADQPNAFAKFQGEQIMDNMFGSKVEIPNSDSCTIAPADKTFQCSLHVAEANLVEGETKAFAERVAACFPGSATTADQGMFGPRYLIETESVGLLVNGDIEEKAIGITIEPKQ